MGDFPEVPLDASSAALAVFRENYGFVPRLFRVQAGLPRLVEAEAALANAILYHDTILSRIEKESVVLAEAAARGNAYCAALQYQTLLLLGVPPRAANPIDEPSRYIRADTRRVPGRGLGQLYLYFGSGARRGSRFCRTAAAFPLDGKRGWTRSLQR